MLNEMEALNIPINGVWDLSQDVTLYDKDTLVAAIINKGGTFEPIYAEPNYLKLMSDAWWYKWKHTFEQWFLDFQIEYNPIYNFDKFHEFDSTINDRGTNDTTKTGREVTDIDTTGSKTSQEVMDGDTTGSKTSQEVLDRDGTSRDVLTQTEVLDGATTGTKSSTEVTDDDIEARKVTDSVEQLSGKDMVDHDYNKDVDVENRVSAFDSNAYQPHDTSHTDDVLSAENTDTTYGKKTDLDITETTTSEEDKRVTLTETTGGTTDNTTTTNSTKTGTTTDDATTDYSETTRGTDDRTTDYTESVRGTDDRTVNTNETIDNDTTNARAIHEEGHDYGNYSSMTAQEMIIKDLKKNYFNIYNAMADIFCREMCVRVF